MARLNKRRTLEADNDDSLPGSGGPARNTPESSHSVSLSSDKENRATASRNGADNGKSKPPMAVQEGPNKRRKLGQRSALEPSQAAFQRVRDGVDDKRYYDPEQPMSERRAVRKGIRDLTKELTDSRNELLVQQSDGIKATLARANELFSDVKQTSDATLDSRLLVTAGDLTARRAIYNKLGGVTTGVDIEEFVGKCMAFMRRGPSEREAAALSLTQSTARLHRSHNQHASDDSDDVAGDDADEGDAYDWEWLGRKACFPYNTRPPVPGFLLGPLSVQKKLRKMTQRSQRQQRRDPADAVRPDEIRLADIDKAENANLTSLCKKIFELLCNYQIPRSERAESEIEALGESITKEEAYEILARNGLRTNTGVCFYGFTFNPQSFGQTVENLFYISFLIRDGIAGLMVDDEGLLTLHPASASTPAQIREQNIIKRQAVFHLDFDTWREIVNEFELRGCIIPHRISSQGQQVGAKGWYG